MFTTYWTPTRPASLNGVRREFLNALNQTQTPRQSASDHLPVTIWEDDQRICLELDVPGFSRDAFDISFQNGQLWVSGERPVAREDGRYLHNERMFGSFRRGVTLPDVVDPGSTEAELEDGVLYITIMKKPEAQPLKISVKGSSGDETKRIVHDES